MNEVKINNQTGRRWVRRILIVASGFILSLLAILTLLVLTFDDEDYRAALILSADHFLDSQLEINGAFSMNYGDDLHFVAKQVRLKAHDSSYDLTIDELDARQQFGSYLTTGTMWFNSVSLANVHLDVTDTAVDAQSAFDKFSFPLVVVEKMSVHDLSVLYKRSDQQSYTLKLSDLQLDDQNNQGPIKLSARGQLNTQAVSIEGTLGSLAQLRDSDTPYPVILRLSSGSLEARLNGNVGNIAPKEYARFDINLKSADVNELAAMLNTTLPAMGPVNASAAFSVTANKLSFDGIKLNVGSLDNPILKVSGSVHSSLSSSSYEAFLSDLTFDVATAKLIQMFNKSPSVGTLGKLQGQLRVSVVDGQWRIETININSTNTELFQLHLVGDLAGLRSEVDVPDPAALGSRLGLDFTGLAPYKTKGVLSVKKDLFSYAGTTHIGRTVNNVDLNVFLADEKPLVRGKITVPVLYPTDFGIALDSVEKTNPSLTQNAGVNKPVPTTGTESSDAVKPYIKQGVPARLFKREPFKVTLLQSFNLELAVLIEKIEGSRLSIEKLDAQVKLREGRLQISPARLTFEGGVTELTLDVDSRDTPKVSFKVTANDLLLGPLIAQLQQEVPIKGRANLLVDINSKGHSEHELASHLNGKVSFRLEDARVPKKYVEYLSADVLGWALRSATFSEDYSQIDCIMMGFDIKKGVAKSQLMFADGPNLTLQGRTTLDFGQETIDMVLLPKEKKSIFSNISAVNVKGPLLNPNVKDLSKETAATNIGAAVFIPGVAIPVYLFNKFWKRLDGGGSSSSSKGCATFIEQQKQISKENKMKEE
ncbi:MAG: AsmA family protein [Porticoccus sp.]|nr:AsmA family protein [Porticoccus sp.]